MFQTLHRGLFRRALLIHREYTSNLDIQMEIRITQAKVIISKKDQRYWLKVSGILKDGEAVTGLLPWAADMETPKLDITPEELEKFTRSEAGFNNRGQLSEIR